MLNFRAVPADHSQVDANLRVLRGEAGGSLREPMDDERTNPDEDGSPSDGRRGGLRVLLANEPRAYRECIAAVFGHLRPGFDVEVSEPGDAEGLIRSSLPDVAICDRATGAIRELVPVWVELYPGQSSRSLASERGRLTEFAEIHLEDLLAVTDRAAWARAAGD